MNMGGVYAVANLRGGGEYGEAWHEAGTKLHKQNVFDDFIAAAEYLIKNSYTKPAKLADSGRQQRRPARSARSRRSVPICSAPRFPRSASWTCCASTSSPPAATGSTTTARPTNADEFKALYAYSPYHNIKPGTKYPATLITTADTDDRVVPGHSFKYAAAIQEAQAGPAPVLIRIETRAGHGGGKPTAKLIEETTDEMAFLVKNLGMKLPKTF